MIPDHQCAYCGKDISNGYIVRGDLFWCSEKCYLSWQDEKDQARWADESSSVKEQNERSKE